MPSLGTIFARLPIAALLLACASPGSAAADPWAAPVAEAAQRFGIPAAWIAAVLRAESGGDPHAVSPAGAMGLMQLMPATWAELRVRHGLGADPFDPHDNVLAGAAYLRALHDRYGAPGFLAAYNAGPARYEASLGGAPLPAETRAYLAALAPVIGGGAAAEAPSDPRAWTHAPIFLTPLDDSAAADPAPAKPPSGNDPASASAPRSGGLFVARTPAGARP